MGDAERRRGFHFLVYGAGCIRTDVSLLIGMSVSMASAEATGLVFIVDDDPAVGVALQRLLDSVGCGPKRSCVPTSSCHGCHPTCRAA